MLDRRVRVDGEPVGDEVGELARAVTQPLVGVALVESGLHSVMLRVMRDVTRMESYSTATAAAATTYSLPEAL